MEHHIGFAFSIEQISYAVFEGNDMMLSDLGAIAYPFEYDEHYLLQQEARISLASALKNLISDKQLHPKSIAFSIESNLAVLKRITYPENLEESGIVDHISWHISESLNLPLQEYAYIRSDNITEKDGLKNELVISIQKKLIRFFRELAVDLQVPLTTLTVHHLAAELALNSALSDQTEQLVVLFKLASNRYECIIFLNGKYYQSHFKRLDTSGAPADVQTRLINLIKEEIGNIENLLLTTDQDEILADRILLYGPDLDDALLSLIQKNMSIPVDRFNPLQNIALANGLQSEMTDETAAAYVECVGVSLDQ